MIEYSAGIVTAYGSAKRAGYTGTYEDFCRQQAQYADNASAVEQAKQTAISASQSADQAKQDAQTASTTAQQSAQSAQGSAQSAGQSAQDAQTSKNNAQTYAQSASASAGSAQQSAQTAQAVLESIPEDYSELSSNVVQLKADLEDNVNDLKSALSYIEETLVAGKLIISGASINNSGIVETTNSGRKLVCYEVSGNITATGTFDLYGFFEDEPTIGSPTYNNSRTIASTISNVSVPTGCKWIAIRQMISSSDVTVSPKSIVDEVEANVDSLVSEVAQIEDVIVSDNAYDYTREYKAPNKSTENVTITWNGDVATINGTPTTNAEALDNYFSNVSSLPNRMYAGEKLYIKVNTTNQYARLAIQPYDANGSMNAVYLADDGTYTIPNTAIGIIIRLSLVINKTYTNDTFEAHVYSALTNADLSTNYETLSYNAKYNCNELLRNVEHSNKSTSNVTITWNGDVATINGTPTTNAEALSNYFSSTTALPEEFNVGDTVYFEVETSNKNARLGFIPYDANGASFGGHYFTENGTYTIPKGTKGIAIRLALVKNKTFTNDTFEAKIFDSPQNKTIENLLERMTASERRTGKETKEPMLTLIDDDGMSVFYTDLYPVATAKKVSISAAIPYLNIGTANHMTLAQVKEMYSNGIEILNHSYAHDLNYQSWTDRDFEDDYRKSVNSYNQIGIPCEILVYTGSTGVKSEAVKAAKRVFSCAIHSGGEHINYYDGDKYLVERYGITDSNDGGRINGNNLSELTDLIDTLKTQGGWMIWMLHTSSNYWNSTMCSNIASAIDYAESVGVPIVTAECGYKTYFGA